MARSIAAQNEEPGALPSGDVSSRRPVVRKSLYVLRRWPLLPILVLTVFGITAIFAPLLSPHDPVRGNLRDRLLPPAWQEGGSTKYFLGTDRNGRDILSRIIHGSRISFIVAGTVLGAGLVVGTTIGLLAGYAGGNLDELLMRFVDFTLAIPFILVAIVVVVVFGSSLALILILLIVFTWGGFARQARAATLSLKTQDYVAMAKIAGASPIRIIVRHILPGIFSTMMVLASLAVGGLILAEATLSFLGVGIPKPAPAWGLMVADGRQFLRDAWWVAMMPGIAIFATVFSVNFLGDWMRDRFDPRLRQL